MGKMLIPWIISLVSNVVKAHFTKERCINILAGPGISATYNSVDVIADTGFFTQESWCYTYLYLSSKKSGRLFFDHHFVQKKEQCN